MWLSPELVLPYFMRVFVSKKLCHNDNISMSFPQNVSWDFSYEPCYLRNSYHNSCIDKVSAHMFIKYHKISFITEIAITLTKSPWHRI